MRFLVFLLAFAVTVPGLPQRYGNPRASQVQKQDGSDLEKKLRSHFEVKQDRFKKETIIGNKIIAPDFFIQKTLSTMFKVKPGNGTPDCLYLFISTTVPDGKKQASSMTLIIGFDCFNKSSSKFASSSWKYIKCHDLDFLVDGTPMPLPTSSWDGDASSGVEFVEASISMSQLKNLSTAKTIEGRLCNDEFVLDERHHWLFNEVLKEIKKVTGQD